MKNEEKAKKCNNCIQKLLAHDQFSQSFKLLIDEGREGLPSKSGALCSILLLILMLIYTGYKISILEGKKDIDIVQAVKENHFDNSHVFGAENGLNLAAAVVDLYDRSQPELIDPSYGRV